MNKAELRILEEVKSLKKGEHCSFPLSDELMKLITKSFKDSVKLYPAMMAESGMYTLIQKVK